MRKHKVRTQSLIEALQYEYTVTCCGQSFTWPGRLPSGAQYICRRCDQEMKATTKEVKPRDVAELIVMNRQSFVEACPECGAKRGHHVHKQGDAYFLRCGLCDCELREVDKEELS